MVQEEIMKLRICSLLGLLLFLLLLAGCARQGKEQSEYSIFYLNKEETKLLPVPYEPGAEKSERLISELLRELARQPESVDYKSPLGERVQVLSWSLLEGQLQLTFGSEYTQMDPVSEVLCRAAVVRTLSQVEGVEFISFSIGDAPLVDKNGTPIGMMTAESFIENPGEQINSIQTATITLYFADKSGDKLVQEVQECHYNSNISMEKLVIEKLIKGPLGAEGISAIPSGTKLINVSVLDGVCFVNFDEGFMAQNYEIEEGVVIYSIVNSLVELTNVNKVQISVNGDTSKTYREKFSLSTVYERDLDYLEAPKDQKEAKGAASQATELMEQGLKETEQEQKNTKKRAE